MLSRRTVIIMGALAASAGLRTTARAQNPPGGGPNSNAPRAILQLQRRNIQVNGKPASVYGIRQPDGALAAGRSARHFRPADPARRRRRLQLSAALRRHLLDAFAPGAAGAAA